MQHCHLQFRAKKTSRFYFVKKKLYIKKMRRQWWGGGEKKVVTSSNPFCPVSSYLIIHVTVREIHAALQPSGRYNNNFPVVLFLKKAQPLHGCAFFLGVVLFCYYRAEGEVVAKKHNPEEKSTTAKGLRFFEEKYHREVIIVSTWRLQCCVYFPYCYMNYKIRRDRTERIWTCDHFVASTTSRASTTTPLPSHFLNI